MKKLLILQFLILLIVRVCFSQSYSNEQLIQLSRSSTWRSLLHDRNFFKDRTDLPYQSEIHGGDFFLAENGATDALAELKETLKLIDSDRLIGLGKQRPFCAFRARYRFLQRELGIKFPDIKCDKWEMFINGFNKPQKLSLIFSSSYPNSPASMFGHLFLKVSSQINSDLLDTGVNYAAQVPEDENGLAFLVFGLFGGYEGHWSIQPYYEKLNEYVKSESRDLWEYELNLNQNEIYFFIEHLWEVETTAINYYYFFDDNCAYRIARIIEAIKPEWRQVNNRLSQYKLNAIPGEIVKNFLTSDQVRKVTFKKSLKKKINYRMLLLDEDDKKIFYAYLKQETSDLDRVKKITDTKIKINILNALNSYIDYLRQKKKGQLSELEQKKWSEVQNYRAELGSFVQDLPAEPVIQNRPDLGHDSYGANIGIGFRADPNKLHSNEQGVFLDYGLRSPYHDLYNIDQGYDQFSQILFPNIEARYYFENKKNELIRLNAIDIKSLTAYRAVDPQISWMLNLGYEKSYLNYPYQTDAVVGEVAAGLGFNPRSDKDIVYTFMGFRNEFTESRFNDYHLLGLIETGYILNYQDFLKVAFELRYLKSLNDQNGFIMSSGYAFSNNITFRLARNIEWRQSLFYEEKQFVSQNRHDSYNNFTFTMGPVFYFR